ncbi:magnesium chelatase subunit H [Phytoactinopolyspora mesophila]|uniref:Magnesium chelatase subunit H n=1 Tax=Phytoactinopolyspora mesophila TaxID=2650750 RepID=A0A7K3M6S8_9ACTN|nr:magnesium chelatase subunit H [Phytoactinopolyspora mesophila]NDL59011.1 magnesium chelatase subunit H [Phytoactinopolyspora mesophila]
MTTDPAAPVRLVTLGFESHGALALRQGVDLYAGGAGPELHWTRFDRTVLASPDRLAEALRDADALLVHAVHDVPDAEALAGVVAAAPELAVVPVQPNAVEVMAATRLGGFGTDPARTRTELAAAAGAAARAGRHVPPELDQVLRVLPGIGRELPPEATSLTALAKITEAFRHLCAANVALALEVLVARLRPGALPEPGWPRPLPVGGFWHPELDIAERWDEFEPRLRGHWAGRGAEPVGRVVLVTMPSQVLSGNAAHVDALVTALEARRIEVIGWLGNLEALGEASTVTDVPGIDLWINASGFTLTGSHGQPNVEFDIELLWSRNTPQLAPVPLFRQSLPEWQGSRVGLTPAQVAMQLAVPELEGGAVPLILGGRDEQSDAMVPLAAHVDRLAGTVARTVALRRKANADKRVAIVIFGYHAAHGVVGTASHLDVFASLHRVLLRLAAAGYSVDVPETPEALLDLVVTDDGGGRRTETNVAARYHAADYLHAMRRHAERATPMWGRPPGDIDTDGVHLDIGGVVLGNVFVGVQPSFGYDDDPVSLLFADPPDSATPSHSFIAFYTWLHQEFGADALLHFGTHGALEFMPGKQAGLAPVDWANLLVHDLPHFYLYCMNNPSEGTIAKRRSQATLASYLTPPLDRAGTYGVLASVSEGVRDALGHEEPGRRAAAARDLVELAGSANLDADPALAETDPDAYLRRLQSSVDEVEQALIPIGMHIVDRGIEPEEALVILRAACDYERPDAALPALTIEFEQELTGGTPVTKLPPDDDGRIQVENRLAELVDAVVDGKPAEDDGSLPARWHGFLTDLRDRLSGNDEAGALLRALDGGYLRPGPGGDPARQLAALPTGRNTHALDPQRVPTPLAISRGQAGAEALLESAREADGQYPETVAIVLWGIDNIKSGGEACAQVFALLGVEPVADTLGRVSRFRVIPLEELGRPRIDVVCTGSGVFRDVLPTTIELLDRAVRAVAVLDEPAEQNYVRAHALDQAAELGISVEDAATRIWSAPPGRYGSGVNHVVDAGQWEAEADLGDIYTRRMAHAYGHRLSGENREKLLRRALGSVRVTFQNIDSAETSLADTDHYFEFLGGITAATAAETGVRPRAMVADSYAARPTVRGLDEAMRLESRTRLLNPKWYEAHLEHGYQGVAAITHRLENTFGMQATTGAVDGWIFSAAATTFMFDDKLRQRMEELNPASVKRFADRLLEAHQRDLWDATDDEVERLDQLSERLDGVLEGVEG